MITGKTPWWRGRRGEWYVIFQLALFLAIVLGPQTLARWPPWPVALSGIAVPLGWGLLSLGALVALIAVRHLGANLTPLPHPKAGATLVVTGLYRVVRHPIYFGVILMAVGYALMVEGWLTLLEALLLAVFFDIKSRREEVWLVEHFPDYAEYRHKVAKLIPFLY